MKSYRHGTDLKYKDGSLHHHGDLNAHVYFNLLHYLGISRSRARFFQVNLKCQWTPPMSRNNSYLLTLQANCATICQMRKHTTPTRPQLTSSDYFVFLREKRDFKTKTNDRVASRLAMRR